LSTEKPGPARVDFTRNDPAARVSNLIGAFHNQLLEVMGAMGIRDARPLRGETGRAMFFEDLDRETFSALFGISVEEDLLKVEGEPRNPLEVYSKVRPEQEHATDRDGLEEWGKQPRH